MRLSLLIAAALLLSVERVTYVFIARRPERFRGLCGHPALAAFGEPIAVAQGLFCGFKAVQYAVFAAWCLVHSGGSPWPAATDPVVPAVAWAAIIAGQVLNVGVFYRLGMAGVVYGDRLGHDVPRCHRFPFTLCAHPQYVGVVLTIWGFFLGMRFPHDDWFALPALETLYYAVGAQLESEPPAPAAVERAPLGGRLT